MVGRMRIHGQPAVRRTGPSPVRIQARPAVLRTAAFLAERLIPQWTAEAESATREAAELRIRATQCSPQGSQRTRLLEQAKLKELRAQLCLEHAQALQQLLELAARGVLDALEAGRERGPPGEQASSP